MVLLVRRYPHKLSKLILDHTSPPSRREFKSILFIVCCWSGFRLRVYVSCLYECFCQCECSLQLHSYHLSNGTIYGTGHCFALSRETFADVGGFTDLERRVDDDHEIARRVRKAVDIYLQ